jgi:hypothetical protein
MAAPSSSLSEEVTELGVPGMTGPAEEVSQEAKSMVRAAFDSRSTPSIKVKVVRGRDSQATRLLRQYRREPAGFRAWVELFFAFAHGARNLPEGLSVARWSCTLWRRKGWQWRGKWSDRERRHLSQYSQRRSAII